jgi:glycosyltransferase involved in cell wall biosynthesis
LGFRAPTHDTDVDGQTMSGGVTIAIPNWNHELLLARSVGSALKAVRALRSRGVGGEVLVIDDASRDGSVVLLRQLEAMYYKDGLRVLARVRNAGLPAVRNTALQGAGQRYVLFMDADNELVPENIWHFYRSIRDTRAAAVYGNLLSRRRESGSVTVLSNESFQDRMFDANYVDAFALFDRAQLLDCGGYSESPGVRGREDWELYLHLAACGRRVVFVPLVLGFYHDLPNSMIKQSRPEGEQKEYVARVYDQLGLRGRMPLNTRHLRYHPDIGYL